MLLLEQNTYRYRRLMNIDTATSLVKHFHTCLLSRARKDAKCESLPRVLFGEEGYSPLFLNASRVKLISGFKTPLQVTTSCGHDHNSLIPFSSVVVTKVMNNSSHLSVRIRLRVMLVLVHLEAESTGAEPAYPSGVELLFLHEMQLQKKSPLCKSGLSYTAATMASAQTRSPRSPVANPASRPAQSERLAVRCVR